MSPDLTAGAIIWRADFAGGGALRVVRGTIVKVSDSGGYATIDWDGGNKSPRKALARSYVETLCAGTRNGALDALAGELIRLREAHQKACAVLDTRLVLVRKHYELPTRHELNVGFWPR